MDDKATRVLTNSIILDKIGYFLPAADSFPLRQTCTLWNSSFVPHLRRNHAPIYLDEYWNHAAAHGQKRGDGPSNIIEFNELLKSNPITAPPLPFSKYNVGFCHTRHFLSFLYICGPRITSLRVERLAGEKLETTTLPEQILKGTPSLAELELMFYGEPDYGTDYDEWHAENGARPTNLAGYGAAREFPKVRRFTLHYTGEDTRVYSSAVASIVQCAPKLDSLGLPGPKWCNEGSYEYTEAIQETFTKIRDTNVCLENLKHIRIDLVKPAALAALTELGRTRGLRLKSFSVTVTGDGCKNEIQRNGVAPEISSFLGTQSRSLEELTLSSSHDPEKGWLPAGESALVILPRLETLRALSITDSYNGNTGLQSILRTQPQSLTRFEMRYEGGGGSDFANNLPAVKKLTLGPGVEIGNPFSHVGITDLAATVTMTTGDNNVHMAALPARFPSVTRLVLSLTVETSTEPLFDLCTLWPELTTLKLKLTVAGAADANPDELLSGVPREHFLKLELDRVFERLVSTVRLESLQALSRKYKTQPGLCDLSRLQEFEFEWVDVGGQAEGQLETEGEIRGLSDIGGYFGLALASDQLQRITIIVGGGMMSSLSGNCIEFLKSTLGVAAVININCDHP